jgi:outer membrane protein OmpA-like peptidoglycan-associated protein
MTARPGFHVRLNGHTDDIGTERFNNLLSWQRARAAQEWLVAQGVDRARIEAQGFGASKPLGGAIIPSARPQNRRVEIEFR